MRLVFVGHFLYTAALAGASADCPCLEEVPALDTVRDADRNIVYTLAGKDYQFPPHYGQGTCLDHDTGLLPYCGDSSAPSWCSAHWCYIDPANCDTAHQRSTFFPQLYDLYFSYRTCGFNNTLEGFLTSSVTSVLTLLDDTEAHLATSRNYVEDVFVNTYNAGLAGSCSVGAHLCTPCESCRSLPGWGSLLLDYTAVGFWSKPTRKKRHPVDENIATCLATSIGSTYEKVASADGSPARIGYQYFADQATGSMTQMPHTEHCPSEGFDPRRRPWFAAGATGPKDVVIVVDTSGSMAEPVAPGVTRADVAQEATMTILDTLSWTDYATIVLFGSSATAYSSLLVPVTDRNRDLMKAWCDQQVWNAGGTSFLSAISTTLHIIRESVAEGQTSTCNRAILFLSDGVPAEWNESHIDDLADATHDLAISVFTYGLGSGSQSAILKQMACQNRGIYYHIADDLIGEDLVDVMTSYYQYFAAGQQKCHGSFAKYTDFQSGATLYASCMPSYNRSGPEPEVLGVNCLDVNLLYDVSTFQSEPVWEDFICHMSAQAKMCVPLELNDCKLRRLRAFTRYAQTCDDEPVPDSCGCVDPRCHDDHDFVDEHGYFCSAWVGARCEEAAAEFRYSEAGVLEILRRCPRSCGTCPNLPAGHRSCSLRSCEQVHKRSDDDSAWVGRSCRACRGLVPGLDIEGKPLYCPGLRPGNLSLKGRGGGNGAASERTSMIVLIVGIVIAGAMMIALTCAVLVFCQQRWKSSLVLPTTSRTDGGGCLRLAAEGKYACVPPAIFTRSSIAGAGAGRGKGGKARAAAMITLGRTCSLALPTPFPETWRHKESSKSFVECVPAPELVEPMQRLLTATYIKVATRDRGTERIPDKLAVTSVRRIENSEVWRRYTMCRDKVAAKRPHRCTRLSKISGGMVRTQTDADVLEDSKINDGMHDRINEVYLFHGTSAVGVDGISQTGFKVNLAGTSTGSMYGPGVYLAEMCSKSDEYAKEFPDGPSEGLCCLLLCRVALGEVLTLTAGGESVWPVVKAALKSNAYDSVMGDRAASVGTYREFIVYNQDQIYPEFIILYKRVHD